MALIGNVPMFLGGGSDCILFSQRLDQFFEANGFEGDKKKSSLLIAIDKGTYEILQDSCHPLLLKDKTYEELIEMLKKQLVVRSPVFRERVKFYKARQSRNESIAIWYARIKKLAVECKFGEHFDMMLLDRFISGLRSTPILDRLCEEDKYVTIEKALKIATSTESSVTGKQNQNNDGGESSDEESGNKNSCD